MKDWLERALKTFVQAFFGVVIAQFTAIVTGISNKADWKTWVFPIIVAAFSAGISAVWNLYLQYSAKKSAEKEAIKEAEKRQAELEAVKKDKEQADDSKYKKSNNTEK